MLACGELTEVAGGLWADVVEETEDDAAEWPVVDGDVELGQGQRCREGWERELTKTLGLSLCLG